MLQEFWGLEVALSEFGPIGTAGLVSRRTPYDTYIQYSVQSRVRSRVGMLSGYRFVTVWMDGCLRQVYGWVQPYLRSTVQRAQCTGYDTSFKTFNAVVHLFHDVFIHMEMVRVMT